MSQHRFDLIVVGGGPGGHAAAEEASRLGARVCIIESNAWGGTCTHRGCIPTKALLTCSRHYAHLKRISRLGIRTDAPTFDFPAICRHRDQMIRVAALGVEKSLQAAGVEMKSGWGEIFSPGEVVWTSSDGARETFSAAGIVIAWGSEVSPPPFPIDAGPDLPPLREAAAPPSLQGGNQGTEQAPDLPPPLLSRVLTSDTFLQLTALPKSVVIVGGSVIGVEFATFLAELGTAVQLVEILPVLLPYEEEEAGEFLRKELARLGVKVLTATAVTELREGSEGIRVAAAQNGKSLELVAEYALLCTGRRPRLEGESLVRLGIGYDRRGIMVNDRQETNVRGIYAVGDVTGGAMLAHRAMQQGQALAGRLFGDGSRVYREEFVPAVTYTHPPIARVGLTERQARERGMDVEVHRSDYGASIMARAELAGQGFVKLLWHTGQLVGATIAGEGAPDLIAALSLAMTAGADMKTLRNWCIPHPTLSEVLKL
ncbi:MAG: NAD(P)/FAD-dependent oxidoreductase [Syntrophobacterales bacterium]|nr:NAD(P)/FAD-dependent oxidoreductase [Syntrophobacterales bacterium]